MTPHPDWQEHRELPWGWVFAIYAVVIAALVYFAWWAMEAI